MTGESAREDIVQPAAPRLRADSLSESVVILMALTLVQPVVSFVRGILFCRWLDPEQLGQWDVSLAFLTLAAPFVVLGIPGSFGRYLEYYRQRGQLRRFLLSATLATGTLTLLATVILARHGGSFSKLLFGTPDRASFVWILALSLGPLVGFGFVTELLNAFRLYRLVSGLQLLRSASFLGIGGLLIFTTSLGAAGVVTAYAVASLAAVALGGIWLIRVWRETTPDGGASSRFLDSRFISFAIWIWMTNNLTNLFDIADRYLLVHFSGLPTDKALELVGNYHSSRVVPMLMVVFANMLASILLPHWSHAWETGNRSRVSSQLSLTLKLYGVAFSIGSAVFLGVAPLLFGTAFHGKYPAGLAVLSWTLVYCHWLGLASIAILYLWCREEARLGSFALLLGLVVSVALNMLLLPRLGLLGAVLACCASKLTLLAATYSFARLLGWRGELGTWLVAALPLALLLGPKWALAAYVVVLIGSVASESLFTRDEKDQLSTTLGGCLRRLRSLPRQPSWGLQR
jgi:O-antigen/teichoic acid export membrane protein